MSRNISNDVYEFFIRLLLHVMFHQFFHWLGMPEPENLAASTVLAHHLQPVLYRDGTWLPGLCWKTARSPTKRRGKL